jgi:hypothetical protein
MQFRRAIQKQSRRQRPCIVRIRSGCATGPYRAGAGICVCAGAGWTAVGLRAGSTAAFASSVSLRKNTRAITRTMATPNTNPNLASFDMATPGRRRTLTNYARRRKFCLHLSLFSSQISHFHAGLSQNAVVGSFSAGSTLPSQSPRPAECKTDMEVPPVETVKSVFPIQHRRKGVRDASLPV